MTKINHPLRDYYPAKRKSELTGRKQTVYIRTDVLTDDDIDQLAKRFDLQLQKIERVEEKNRKIAAAMHKEKRDLLDFKNSRIKCPTNHQHEVKT
jgi:hypothetical protein